MFDLNTTTFFLRTRFTTIERYHCCNGYRKKKKYHPHASVIIGCAFTFQPVPGVIRVVAGYDTFVVKDSPIATLTKSTEWAGRTGGHIKVAKEIFRTGLTRAVDRRIFTKCTGIAVDVFSVRVVHAVHHTDRHQKQNDIQHRIQLYVVFIYPINTCGSLLPYVLTPRQTSM